MRELTMEEVRQVAGGLTGTAGWPYGPSGSGSGGSVFSSNGFTFWAGTGLTMSCIAGITSIAVSDGTISVFNGTQTVAACLAPAYALANGFYSTFAYRTPENTYDIAVMTDGGRLHAP